ncbi:MAG TPA: glycosyltransferase [Alphaproteobacteria bacterium]|nr:glycosyltransferase [Alphaproteobacteria bacterium]
MADPASLLRLTLIICTYNRVQSLRQTLRSLRSLDVDGVEGEIIVVDNNSHDETRRAIEEFLPLSPLPARYLFEPRQGLSHARNAGIEVATGDIIVFSDDDVLVDPFWLREIAAAFAQEDPAALGGKILPKWQAPPPRWLGPALHGFLALLDHGDKPMELREPLLWGANLAVRRDVFRTFRFHVGLGRTGDKLYIGEDSDLLQRLIERGERVMYWPRAVVHHNIPAQRLTKTYFRKWNWDAGSMVAQRMPQNVARSLFGIPYHYYRRTITDAARWARGALTRNGDAFLAELQLVRTAGFATTRVKGRLRRRPMR